VKLKLVYHVPRSQVWAGSVGAQRGNTHLHVTEALDSGRLHRRAGRALCGKNGWYERNAEFPSEFDSANFCPRCTAMAERHGFDLETDVVSE
jgi:hypothetical protein